MANCYSQNRMVPDGGVSTGVVLIVRQKHVPPVKVNLPAFIVVFGVYKERSTSCFFRVRIVSFLSCIPSCTASCHF